MATQILPPVFIVHAIILSYLRQYNGLGVHMDLVACQR